MDLKTFVAESIKQIAEGIKEAQNADTGAWVSPLVGSLVGKKPQIWDNITTADPQVISFDIAVTAVESDAKKGGGGMQVLGIAIGGGLESSTQNSSVSRIRFDLPIIWPRGKQPKN